MMAIRKYFWNRILPAATVAALLGAVATMVAAESIDPGSTDAQYAWGENVGWINGEPSGNGGPGITVSGTKLTGYMYGENIGWINLNCSNNATCAGTGNYGVTNDGAGHLAGYAWGENVGWISFSCNNNAPTCASTGNYGVNIDPATGLFNGKAYGENIGWIVFDYTTSAVNRVKTDDGDGVVSATDNCVFDANANQLNNDRNFTNLHVFGKVFDDITLTNSDGAGDACDSDDDNDALLDTVEPQVGPAGTAHAQCLGATGPTDPFKNDTDGDRILDGAECALGSDPLNPLSKPTVAQCVTGSGAATNLTDSDGDGIKDYVEYCNYNSNPRSANTDGDGCGDAREIASVNDDNGVDSRDLGTVASSFGLSTNPLYIADFDTNKDGVIASNDLGYVASRFGQCP
jgi:hypothetical protein